MRKTIWEFFVEHHRFTCIVIGALVLAGLYAVAALPKESDPEVDIPIAVVTTVFPGASPLDVEELVTNVLEDEIVSISGIDDIDSTSQSGVSSIVVEFAATADRDEVIKDLKDAVDSTISELPDQSEDPVVTEITLSDEPFLQIAVGGDFDLSELTHFAKQLEAAAEGVQGVSDVQVLGGQSEEIQVIVDKARLDGSGFSIGQVTRAIASANSDIPVGSIETGGENFNIRLAGRLQDVEDVIQVPVGSIDGVVIRVGDIARVQSGYTIQTSASRLSIANTGSTPAVTLLVYKSSGGDITRISANVKQAIAAIVDTDLPDGVDTHIVLDFSEYIQDDLTSLSRNGLATIVIVFFILLAFLGFREALMASLAIPLSFLMALTGLLFFDMSINFMTLFSLILALGILVDSAIVINQAMHSRIEHGEIPIEAARKVIHEFQWPLIAGTLTTVFAFVPMLLTSGIIGEYIKSIPITVSSVLISSLFVALAINTTLSVVFSKKFADTQKGPSKTQRYFRNVMDMLQQHYEKTMKEFLHKKSQRRLLTVGIIIAMIIAYSLPAIGALDVNMFPTSNEPTFAIDIELPVGTPLAETEQVLSDIESMLVEDPYIVSYVTTAGRASTAGSTGSGSEHTGYITIDLVEKNRPTSISFVETYQRMFDNAFPSADITVSQGNFGPPSEAPVVVTIVGQDLDTLDSLAKEFETVLENIDGTRNINASVVETNGEFVVHVDRGAAERYGLTATDVALTLRNAINGTEATSLNIDGDDVDVVVRYGLSADAVSKNIFDTTSLETIRSLTLATPVGAIPVASVADVRFENSRLTIEHEDGVRIAKVTSFTESGVTASDVFKAVQSELDRMQLPTGYEVKLGGENEDINQSFTDMFTAMILAVFLIASLMVLQFNSFKQMGIILITIPLALIGVFPGLALLGLPLSFPGIIGIVALVGIVVNNAIILIDTINNHVKGGSTKEEAIIAAGKARLEPIILTTITTVMGLMPLAITEEVWRSLGFAIIFGLTFSTLLTLVIIPILYNKYIRV